MSVRSGEIQRTPECCSHQRLQGLGRDHDSTDPHPAYDERWPAEFVSLRGLLADALGDIAVNTDHIGSTSVPGLAAKNIIDVQVSVADLDDPRLVPCFQRLGATPTDIVTDHVPPGEQGSPPDWWKRYFRPPTSWRRTHIHVRAIGRSNQRYALLFRDYLRASPAAAAAYGQVQSALARLHPDDPVAYYEVKDPVCDLVMNAAEHWATEVAWRP